MIECLLMQRVDRIDQLKKYSDWAMAAGAFFGTAAVVAYMQRRGNKVIYALGALSVVSFAASHHWSSQRTLLVAQELRDNPRPAQRRRRRPQGERGGAASAPAPAPAPQGGERVRRRGSAGVPAPEAGERRVSWRAYQNHLVYLRDELVPQIRIHMTDAPHYGSVQDLDNLRKYLRKKQRFFHPDTARSMGNSAVRVEEGKMLNKQETEFALRVMRYVSALDRLRRSFEEYAQADAVNLPANHFQNLSGVQFPWVGLRSPAL